MSTERLKKHVARVQAESTTFKKKLKSEGGSLRAELAKARQREYEAIGFTFASCAAWEAAGRRIGTMQVATLIDAWEKARTAVIEEYK